MTPRLSFPCFIGAAAITLACGCAMAASDALIASPPQTDPSMSSCQVRDPGLAKDYDGDCEAGLANGEGLANGTNGRYQGEFSHGAKQGRGIYYYANGDIYAGQWRNDARDGSGTYWFGKQSEWNGDRYQGEWRQDNYDGQGKYTFSPSGDSYRARWKPKFTDSPPTATMLQRARADLAIQKSGLLTIGAKVCSVTTPGSWPKQIAHGIIENVRESGTKIFVHVTDNAVVAASPLYSARRWESASSWRACS